VTRPVGRDRGAVAVEWVAGTGLLLLPVVILVATLPVWAERRHAAAVAAREAAAVLVRDWPAADPGAAARVAREVMRDHGIGDADVSVHVQSAGGARGAAVRVEVVVEMPAVAVLERRVGSWPHRAVAVRRVDDYRSR
jgi:hypothetical protein